MAAPRQSRPCPPGAATCCLEAEWKDRCALQAVSYMYMQQPQAGTGLGSPRHRPQAWCRAAGMGLAPAVSVSRFLAACWPSLLLGGLPAGTPGKTRDGAAVLHPRCHQLGLAMQRSCCLPSPTHVEYTAACCSAPGEVWVRSTPMLFLVRALAGQGVLGVSHWWRAPGSQFYSAVVCVWRADGGLPPAPILGKHMLLPGKCQRRLRSGLRLCPVAVQQRGHASCRHNHRPALRRRCAQQASQPQTAAAAAATSTSRTHHAHTNFLSQLRRPTKCQFRASTRGGMKPHTKSVIWYCSRL